MRNLIALKVDLESTFVPLSAAPLVATFTLVIPAGSSQDVVLEGTDGKELPLSPGSQYRFERVDLSRIRVKSKGGESVLVLGHSA